MTRSHAAWLFIVAVVACRTAPVLAQATANPDLAGRWTLNRDLSQFPTEIGFGTDWLATGAAPAPGAGGRGRRGSGGTTGATAASEAAAFARRPESVDDATRVQTLTAEVRTPPARLAISDAAGAITVINDCGETRTFHPDGRDEVLQINKVPVSTISTREPGRLTVLYKVEQGRELRYTYTTSGSPARLIVDVQFLEHGQGDVVRRVYDAGGSLDSAVAGPPKPGPVAAAPQPPTGSPVPDARGMVPASGGSSPAFNQQPDAELKGLKRLGIVVEGLGQQASTCGLKQETIEAAVAKQLTDAGFTVVRNTDEDWYVYVNIMTASMSNGVCVSRYDVFVYTHTTASLSYQPATVLVEVSLLHEGGLAGGGPAAHTEGVMTGIQGYLDRFTTRIRDANK